MKVNGWKFFEDMFSKRDFVIAVTIEDRFLWGYIDWTNKELLLTRPNCRTEHYSWSDIRFVAHSGFPVRKVSGEQHEGEIARYREMLAEKEMHHCEDCSKYFHVPSQHRYSRAAYWCPECRTRKGISFNTRFGDPFEIRNVSMQLFNRGCVGLYFDDTPLEEFVLCSAPNGSVGFLYNLDTLFGLEKER